MALFLPGNFENPKKSDTSEDGESQRRHHVVVGEDELQYTADDDEAVETVEQGDKVTLRRKKTSLAYKRPRL